MKRLHVEGGFGLDHLKLVDLPDPEPGHGQIRIRMTAASLNYRDLATILFGGHRLPLVPLSDGCGVVEAVGPGVTRVKSGDRVITQFFQGWLAGEPTAQGLATALGGSLDGCLTEKMVLSEEGVTRAPESLSDLEAACLPCAGLTAWRASAEAARNALALTATQAVLAREQRLAAIGGIAAAAAHELGTPLATIQLTAKEMARAIPEDSPLADDARLLVQQAERCRDILGQLSRRGDEADAGIARADFRTLLEEIAEPFRHFGAEIDISVSGSGRMPDLTRAPEIIYGLGNIVENAVDFAAARVTVTGVWTGHDVTVTIEDDGEGFDPEVLAKLGEPYVSTREGAADAGGMGLGVFIADTLISRTGGKITFSNTASGARAVAVWPLSAIQAPPYSPSADPQPI